MALSLDIVNAFNSLPWNAIGRALAYDRILRYLVAILADYFRNRSITYMDGEKRKRHLKLECGVPQGSVVGPLLWNLAYDVTLQTAIPPGNGIICYTDDTLLLSGGEN